MSNERMNTATDKIVDMYFRKEERHCLENIEGELLTNKKMFVDYVKEHILYSIITMKFNGNLNKINKWLNQFWTENNKCEENEEEEKQEEEEERVVAVARYNVYEVFKIPKSINLEDKTQVESYHIKYNTLHIYIVGEEDTIEINGENWIDNFDYKYADSVDIQPADDWGVDYDEEDEDE